MKRPILSPKKDIRALFAAWRAIYGDADVRVQKVWRDTHGAQLAQLQRTLRSVIDGLVGTRGSAMAFSKWLTRHRGVVVDGWRLDGTYAKPKTQTYFWSVAKPLDVEALADRILEPLGKNPELAKQVIGDAWLGDTQIEPAAPKPRKRYVTPPAKQTERLPSWMRNGGKRAPIIRGMPMATCESEAAAMRAADAQFFPKPKQWSIFDA
jgi:hypothetical protein